MGPFRAEIQLDPSRAPAASASRRLSSRRSWLARATVAFGVTMAVLTLAAAAALTAYGWLHDGRILPGVEIAGVPVGGLDRVQAEARLREQLPSLAAGHLAVRVGDDVTLISYAEIDRDYDLQLMLDRAFAAGRADGPLQQARAYARLLLSGESVEPVVRWDGASLARRIEDLAASARAEPVDASLVGEGVDLVVVPAQDGRTVATDQAIDLATQAVANVSSDDTSISVAPAAIAPHVPTATAQIAVDRLARVTGSRLMVTGDERRTAIPPSTIAEWVRLEAAFPGEWQVVIDRPGIVELVAGYASDINRPAVPGLTIEGGSAMAAAGSNGQKLDVEASVDALVAELERRAAGETVEEIALVIGVLEPPPTCVRTDAPCPQLELLAKWRTNFVIGPANFYGRNISIPTSILDGRVIQPGQTFDFLDAIGPITKKAGYGDGGAIIRGRTRPQGALGGGICSCSTTLFNVALRAGLDIGSRHNHGYYINRYPLGLDATVWISGTGRRETLSFTNDLEYPVMIRGINRRGAVIFELRGVSDGRTVEISRPTRTHRRPAYEVLQYTDTLPAGQRKRVESAIDGLDVTVTRVVRSADGQILHEDTFRSRYGRVLGITLVGRAEGDPPHGTRVRADGSDAANAGD